MDFWLMRELGQSDSIVRNYVELRLDHHHDNNVFVYSAVKRMGIECRSGNWHYAIMEVRQRLINMGWQDPDPDPDVVRIRLNQWWVWDRIKQGDIRKWPRLKKENPLIN